MFPGPRSQGTSERFSEDLQDYCRDAWQRIQPSTRISFEPTVGQAIQRAKSLDPSHGVSTLITGSLYLVGAALRTLEPNEDN